jgi:hypothetical protein
MNATFGFRNSDSSVWNSARPVNNIVGLGNSRRSVVFDPSYMWIKPTKERLNELVSELTPNWNGYGAKPVNFLNAHFAYQILEKVCLESTPPPSIVPGAWGDLQIEWHTKRIDLELHVLAPNKVHATLNLINADGSIEEEYIELENDFTKVTGWVSSLVEGELAPIASAA